MVIKNLRARSVDLDVVVDGKLTPIALENRRIFEVPDEVVVRNLKVLLEAKDVIVLGLPRITGLSKPSDI
jgi:hypothetical protein